MTESTTSGGALTSRTPKGRWACRGIHDRPLRRRREFALDRALHLDRPEVEDSAHEPLRHLLAYAHADHARGVVGDDERLPVRCDRAEVRVDARGRGAVGAVGLAERERRDGLWRACQEAARQRDPVGWL